MAYLDHTFGIEVECYLPQGATSIQLAAAITARLGSAGLCRAENYNHLNQPHWKIVTDGSLGDYQRGVEIVSPILQGQAGIDACTKVLEAIDDFGCTVSRSCGLHVHIGVGDHPPMTFFRNLFKLYAVFEPAIDGFMPPSRRASANTYCRSMTSAGMPTIDNAANIDTILSALTTRGSENRYFKLNFAAYRRHRTVEFRQHSGTTDARKVRRWVIFCLRMVEAAHQGKGADFGRRGGGAINRGRQGTKSRLVGDMMLRTEGVTTAEALAATGWPAISMPQQARACGLSFTTQRTGRITRYFAQAAQATSAVAATLDGLMTTIEADSDDRAYFAQRTTNLSGNVAWAA